MLKLAVAGDPIEHSLSPVLFKACNLHGTYTRIQTSSPKQLINFLKENNFNGANLTSPLKETIIPFLDEMDKCSQKIGAVNTITIHNNKIKGYNTDPFGIINSLKNFSLEKTNALIIGSGGACKSAIYALQQLNTRITVTARNITKLTNLKNQFSISTFKLDNLNHKISDYELIISTIPNILELPSPPTINNEQIFLDANYKLLFITKYPNRINGLAWLKGQAIKAFEIFSNEEIIISNFDSNMPNIKNTEYNNFNDNADLIIL